MIRIDDSKTIFAQKTLDHSMITISKKCAGVPSAGASAAAAAPPATPSLDLSCVRVFCKFYFF